MREYEHKQEFNERFLFQKKKIRRLRWVLRVIILGGLALTLFLTMRVSPVYFAVGLAVVSLAAGALNKKIISLEDEVKTLNSYAALMPLSQKLSPLKLYDPFSMMNKDEVTRVNIPANWADVTGSDLVEGAYKGVPLRFSDVKMIYYVEDEEGDMHPRTSFGGQVFTLRMKAPINGKVWIGRFADDESPILSRAAYEKRIGVAVTNVAGLERQNIFASSAEVAAQLLTDEYVGKLRQVFSRGDGRLFLCFDGDTLYGAKDSRRDLFENKGERDWDTMSNTDLRELNELLELIDRLTDNPALFNRVDIE